MDRSALPAPTDQNSKQARLHTIDSTATKKLDEARSSHCHCQLFVLNQSHARYNTPSRRNALVAMGPHTYSTYGAPNNAVLSARLTLRWLTIHKPLEERVTEHIRLHSYPHSTVRSPTRLRYRRLGRMRRRPVRYISDLTLWTRLVA